MKDTSGPLSERPGATRPLLTSRVLSLRLQETVGRIAVFWLRTLEQGETIEAEVKIQWVLTAYHDKSFWYDLTGFEILSMVISMTIPILKKEKTEIQKD